MSYLYETVTIVGLGLLGGSIGLSLQARRLARRILGVARRPEVLQTATELQAITGASTSLEQAAEQSQLTIICVPVQSIPPLVVRAARVCPRGAYVTDVGSTKQMIVGDVARQLSGSDPFVGSHPIAGSHRQGLGAARADLLNDATTVITPSEQTSRQATRFVQEFWESLGTHVVQMSPDEHDAVIAQTSHLPHLIAAALAAATPPHSRDLLGSGWRDTTRVAAGSIDLWMQILRSNRGYALQALDSFDTVLARLRNALHNEDWHAVEGLLREGKQNRDAVGN